jgi:uncharacterized RDD family membrane protein YckC
MDRIEVYSYLTIALIILSIILFPVFQKLTPQIVSPYIKANEKKRLFAAAIDVSVCSLFIYYSVLYESIYFFAFGTSYILFKDSIFHGKSLGKMLFGLMVIRVSDGKPCKVLQSVLRNAFFVIPGMNIVSLIFEVYFIINDGQGMRLGDKLAQTQVVEGKEMPELVKYWELILSYYSSLVERELPQKELGKRRHRT